MKTDGLNALYERGAEGNNVGAGFITISLAPYADLVTSAVTAPALTIGDPAQVTVAWTVANRGTGPGLTANWVDAVIVSGNTVVGDSDDRLLAEFAHSGTLAVDESYSRSEAFLLPAEFVGRFHLFVKTDAKGVVFENDSEANNVSEGGFPFDVTPIPYADLVVSSLTADNTAKSGQPMHVSWMVRNQGIGITNTGGWTDIIELASDPTGQQVVATYAFSHIGALAKDGTYDRGGDILLPNGISGTFYVVVRAAAVQGPFEFVFAGNNRAVSNPVAVTLAPSPDLLVTNITAPSSVLEQETVDVSWTVSNVGSGEAVGQWIDHVFLVPVGRPDLPNIDLGSFTYDRGLEADKNYTRTEHFTLPAKIEGVYQVVVTTNALRYNEDPLLYEHGTAADNNQVADDDVLRIGLKPRPDLQISSVISPDRVPAGGTASVKFTVINQGTVATTTPHWKDFVYLSLDSKITPDDILLGSFDNGAALNPGEQYTTETGPVVIPIRFRGDVFLLVSADEGRGIAGVVDEYPNDNNNLAAVPLYVVPLPLADLVAKDVVAPTQAIHGSEIEVRYTVANRGSGPTDKTAWTDTVWLTRDKTRPHPRGNAGILLGTFQHTGGLAVGESYDQIVKVTLPEKMASGIYYITPWSDALDVVLEDTLAVNVNPDDPHEFDNNNYKARAIDIIGEDSPSIPLPDLVVTSAIPTAQAVGGTTYTATWTVENLGLGDTGDGGWVDALWISDMPTPGTIGAKEWFLGAIQHQGALAKGASYTVEQIFSLAPSVAGTYLIVKTDYSQFGLAGNVSEGNETNNVRVVATDVTTRPADLRVTSVTAPSQNFSGEKTTIQWTVKNFGEAVWSGTRYWVDQVFLSPDPLLIPERAITLGEFVHSNEAGLGAGQSYTQSGEVTLPQGIGGTFYVYVVTDYSGKPTKGMTYFGNAEFDRGVNGSMTDVEDRNPSSSDVRPFYRKTVFEGIPNGGNNLGQGAIPITYREPDLRVTDLLAPATAPQSGQTVPVSWTVTNIGTRDTRQGGWMDRVYLSKDATLDSGDLFVGVDLHAGVLATGSSYSKTMNITLPEGIQGNFYLLVFVDSDTKPSSQVTSAIFPGLPGVAGAGGPAAVPEFRGEGNNITAAALPVTLRLPPDLQVTQLSVPEHAIVGQFIDLTYRVTNNGSGDTPTMQGAWTDLIYLSRDQFLDLDADRFIGSEDHQGGLRAGESYQLTEHLRLPKDLSGPFYVFVVTDPFRGNSRGKVFEDAKEQNNATVSAQPLLIELPPPSDLRVDSLAFDPSALKSGDALQIQWTVSNHSSVPSEGAWTDALYLSDDNVWDLNDRLMGKASFTGTLTTGQSYTSSLNVTVPPTKVGQYRLIVRPDIFNEVYEGLDEANNVTTSPNTLTVSVDEVHLGVPFNTTLSTGQSRVFRITVDQGETLRVRLTSAEQDASNELFLRYGDVPTGFQFDAIYQDALQANQTAVIPTTKPGEYYILIRGQSEPKANTPVTILADVLPFGITSIKQDQGGDSRWVTVTITGAKFKPGAVVKLLRPDIAEFEPARYQVIDATTIIATFDFTDAPHGLYDVKVINPDGQVAIEPYRYLIERALEPDVTIGVGGPRVILAGDTGTYGVALQSLTNVDTPYVYFTIGVPEMLLNEIIYNLPYVSFFSNVAGRPDGQTDPNIPWASLDSAVNTTGQVLAPGYAFDVGAGGFVGFTFNASTYPGLKELHDRDFEAFKEQIYALAPQYRGVLDAGPQGLDEIYPGLYDLYLKLGGGVPDECRYPFIPFRFNISASATALTREEFIAQQTAEALKLRSNILADPNATTALVVLAADADTWVQSYLGALEQGGLLRPEAEIPPIRQDQKVVSLLATLATGVLLGPVGDQITTTGNLLSFCEQVH